MLLRLLVWSIVFLDCGGCATQASWAPAIGTDARFWYVPGPAIKAGYIHAGSDIYWVSVPVSPDGHALPPFEYTGPRATLGDVWAHLTSVDAAAVRDEANRIAVLADSASPPAPATAPGVLNTSKVTAPAPVLSPDGELVAVIYQVTADGRMSFIEPPSQKSTWSTTDPIPSDAAVALLPGSVNRSGRVVFGYRALAIFETPVDIVFDLLVFPVLDVMSKVQ